MNKKLANIFLASCIAISFVGCSKENMTTENAVEEQTPKIILGDEASETKKEIEQVEASNDNVTTKGYSEASTETPQEQEEQLNNQKGPVLVIGSAPKNAVLIETKESEDGSYYENLSCEEGKLFIHIEKNKEELLVSDLQTIQSRFESQNSWKDITLAEQDDALSESFGYPVYRFRFSTGEGEETNLHDAIFVAGNQYTFLLDCYAEASEYHNQEELMEVFITTSYLFDEDSNNDSTLDPSNSTLSSSEISTE